VVVFLFRSTHSQWI